MSHAKIELLRHTVATLAYRGAKAVADVTSNFPDFTVLGGTRQPVEILAHVGDLLDWAGSLVGGQHVWRDSAPLPWDAEVERFFAGLAALDNALARANPDTVLCEKLFQGPIADALTHIGQISLLRRMAGCPVRGENYFKAAISIG